MRKRLLVIFLAVSLLLSAFTGCAKKSGDAPTDFSIVTTIFPVYDFVRQVVGDAADVTMLLSPGMSAHSYDPTPQDIIEIQNCDMFVYIGGESDEWVADILSSADASGVTALALMEYVDVLEEETVEGMHDEHEHEHEHEHSDEVYDEHIWTSPINAIKMVEAITVCISQVLPEKENFFADNSAMYISKLESLSETFVDIVSNASRSTLVFADRFPMLYFAGEYSLDYFAVFPGCSEETEPSAATLAFLIDKVKAEQIPVVFYTEFSNEKIADTVCEATSAKKLLFHSCHNVTKDDFNSGVTYLDLMLQNSEALKEALN